MRAGLTVGGIEVEVHAPRGPLEGVLLERYSPFLGAVTDPVCKVGFVPTDAVEGAENPPMAEVEVDGTHARIDHVDFAAELDLTGEGKVSTAANPFTIDHFFRLLYGMLVPRYRAVMLHACGIIAEGRAGVFAGQSGAGKSTLASLAEHRPLLSDEHVVIRELDGTWVAASTPFWGSYAKPGPARQAPLGLLCELVQWPHHELRPLDQVEGLRLLLEHSVLPGPDPSFRHAVFEVAADLAAATQAAQLRFTPKASVWDVIDERLAA